MHRSVRLIAAFGLLLIPALVWADAKDDAKAELKKFAGTWKIVSIDGKKLTDEEREKTRLIFDGEKFTVKRTGEKEETTTFKIDASKKPPRIDIGPREGEGARLVGIYKFEDGKLTICASDNGGERPTEFKSVDKGGALMVLEKETK